MTTQKQDFLGRGLQYPIDIDSFGRAKLIQSESLVQQAIWDLLHTPRGTRFNLSNYGSDLHQLEEKPMPLVLGLIKTFVIRALRQEQRVRFLDLKKTVKRRELICELTYLIR